MTVSHTSVFTPMAAALPPDTDLDAILLDLSVNHVATPSGQDQTQLAEIVTDARAHGIQLSIVVLQGNRGRDSDLRDLATEVGKQEHGTVVALSDDWAGTYSDTISRDRLERAEDVAKNRHAGHSVEAARAFVDSLEKPETISWTAVTAVLLTGTIVFIAGLYFLKSRRAARETGQPVRDDGK
ncbi:DUF6676 family protein [Nocardia terpenica]|uniref:TPM domain-containing protein n=1 Tax=Nocardia terpenica TaxID=455432 RepID=A0A164LJY4_9NOCA|nr:DUF6676 family protein [Nocardia terpenica]KZM72491.1 hypothetical protein AWN90_27150 [Nocardia terpenica]NQE92641.1 hypothetical protein [Nocardia terpenica]